MKRPVFSQSELRPVLMICRDPTLFPDPGLEPNRAGALHGLCNSGV